MVDRAAEMDQKTARNARESLDLAFQMSNILETGLDCRTLSILVVLCERGVNREALAAVVKELHRDETSSENQHLNKAFS